MKNISLLLIVSFITMNLLAQPPGNSGGGNRQGGNIGHIYGKVIDSSGKPVSASVFLLQGKFDSATKKTKEALLKGGVASAKGEFSFDELPVFGQLKLKITAVGFKPYEQVISFIPKRDPNAPKPTGSSIQTATPAGNMPYNVARDLGNIKLTSDATTLQAITVT